MTARKHQNRRNRHSEGKSASRGATASKRGRATSTKDTNQRSKTYTEEESTPLQILNYGYYRQPLRQQAIRFWLSIAVNIALFVWIAYVFFNFNLNQMSSYLNLLPGLIPLGRQLYQTAADKQVIESHERLRIEMERQQAVLFAQSIDDNRKRDTAKFMMALQFAGIQLPIDLPHFIESLTVARQTQTGTESQPKLIDSTSRVLDDCRQTVNGDDDLR